MSLCILFCWSGLPTNPLCSVYMSRGVGWRERGELCTGSTKDIGLEYGGTGSTWGESSLCTIFLFPYTRKVWRPGYWNKIMNK